LGEPTNPHVIDLQQRLREIEPQKEDADQGIYSSMHVPGNQTPPAEHVPTQETSHQLPAMSTPNPAMVAVMNSLNAITGSLNMFNACFNALEQ
jgi:hypothetical protein